MIDKYKDDLERLYQGVFKERKKLSDVVKNTSMFKDEGMSIIDIAGYLNEYAIQKNVR